MSAIRKIAVSAATLFLGLSALFLAVGTAAADGNPWESPAPHVTADGNPWESPAPHVTADGNPWE